MFIQAARRNPVKTRRFTLQWRGASGNEGQKYHLEQAWATAYGPVKTMTYTPVDDVDANAIQVAFVEGSLSMARTAPGLWDMQVQIEEVL